MKYIITILIFFSFQTIGRESGQTEITTDDGIEVFNKEKYYLLKTNVKIISDEYELNADLVKAYFNKDLYDITRISSNGNVTLNSSKGIKATGEKIDFDIVNEDLQILSLSAVRHPGRYAHYRISAGRFRRPSDVWSYKRSNAGSRQRNKASGAGV